MKIVVQNGSKGATKRVGRDGSSKLEFLGLFLEVFPNGHPADFGSLVGKRALAFEANIGIVEQIKHQTFFFPFPPDDQGGLVFHEFGLSGKVNGFTHP